LVLNIHYLFKILIKILILIFAYSGMSMGNDSEWNRLWDIFLNEQDIQEKEKLMNALTAPKDTSLLTK